MFICTNVHKSYAKGQVMPKLSVLAQKKKNQISEISMPASFTEKSLYIHFMQTQCTYILLSKPLNWFRICVI